MKEYRIVGEVIRDYFALMPSLHKSVEEMDKRNSFVGPERYKAAPFICEERLAGSGPKDWRPVSDSDLQTTRQAIADELVGRRASLERKRV